MRQKEVAFADEGTRHCGGTSQCFSIRFFVLIMCLVIGVQGTYLGYIVGVQTSLERRFEITSSQIGILLAMYDIGHTLSVLLVGHFGSHGHKPRWTAAGTLVSGLAMFGLALPNLIYGSESYEEGFGNHHDLYVNYSKCDTERHPNVSNAFDAYCQRHMHFEAYVILAVSQLIAGMAAAPFNTLAYIYVDDNVERRKSPLYLGLLTSMYAFGPALGFGLSALCNHLYVKLTVNAEMSHLNPNWVGAWWLGFLVCGCAYILVTIPMFMFPKDFKPPKAYIGGVNEMAEMSRLNGMPDIHDSVSTLGTHRPTCTGFVANVRELPVQIFRLLKNPIYTSMMLAWIFGAYLVGGFGTYLPKFIESQYQQTASMSDLYAGIISIGSVAVSTAVGGYLLTRFNIGPRHASLFLLITWSVIICTHVLAVALGCDESHLVGTQLRHDFWNFTAECNLDCGCDPVRFFDPVCSLESKETFFSPCHAGCVYNETIHQWVDCLCANGTNVASGFCATECAHGLPLYMLIMFTGLFVGNLFFMATMMVILRCVEYDSRSLGLSFASSCTNIFGFIPSPIIFGVIIDSACTVWHSHCPESGNCILYDNSQFRNKYHLYNAMFQLLAVVAVAVTYFKSRKFVFPEEEEGIEEYDYD